MWDNRRRSRSSWPVTQTIARRPLVEQLVRSKLQGAVGWGGAALDVEAHANEAE